MTQENYFKSFNQKFCVSFTLEMNILKNISQSHIKMVVASFGEYMYIYAGFIMNVLVIYFIRLNVGSYSWKS